MFVDVCKVSGVVDMLITEHAGLWGQSGRRRNGKGGVRGCFQG
jgi:hypothetical protein